MIFKEHAGCGCDTPCHDRDVVDMRCLMDVDDPSLADRLLERSRSHSATILSVEGTGFTIIPVPRGGELEMWSETMVLWFEFDGAGCRLLDEKRGCGHTFGRRSAMLESISTGVIHLE